LKDETFWNRLDHLVANSQVTVDRRRGSSHPCFPDFVYPYDYGYLQDTRSGDGEEIDVWIGSLSPRRVTSVICTVDVQKRNVEIKILLSCTEEETQAILRTHHSQGQAAILLRRRIET
jgi:inorganic pyrophosphatase